jgi:hypothetical protein
VAEAVQRAPRSDHEGRLRALEQSFAGLSAQQTATQKEITDLRGELFGDPTRKDDAGRGALVLLQESVNRSGTELAAQLRRTAQEITSKYDSVSATLTSQIAEVKGKLASDEQLQAQRKADKRSRRFQVFLYVGGGVAVAVASYLIGLLGSIHP